MAVDFQVVRDTIRKSQEMLDGLAHDAQSQRKLLEERAARFAEDRSAISVEEARFRVIEVRRSGHHLGLPSETMREVRMVRICALPYAGSTIVGLFHIRGETFCAIDVLPLLGGDTVEVLQHGDECMVAVIDGEQGKIGIRIDEVIGPRAITSEEAESGLNETGIDFLAAVTSTLLAVVDVPKLLGRPEVILDSPW